MLYVFPNDLTPVQAPCVEYSVFLPLLWNWIYNTLNLYAFANLLTFYSVLLIKLYILLYYFRDCSFMIMMHWRTWSHFCSFFKKDFPIYFHMFIILDEVKNLFFKFLLLKKSCWDFDCEYIELMVTLGKNYDDKICSEETEILLSIYSRFNASW